MTPTERAEMAGVIADVLEEQGHPLAVNARELAAELRYEVDPSTRRGQPVLCYVDDHSAFFTTQALSEQWGDDWNDAPYDCNAGEPYKWGKREKDQGIPEWEIIRVVWTGPFATLADWDKDRWSVQEINARHVAWLLPTGAGFDPIFAGMTLDDFEKRIEAAGGTTTRVFERESLWEY